MALKDNVRKAIRSGEDLARSCQVYAREADNDQAAKIFLRMAENILSSVAELRSELKKYCGP